MTTSVTMVKGIGPATAKVLEEHGINSLEELVEATLATLMTIPGFNHSRANNTLKAAKLAAAASAEVDPTLTSQPPAPMADSDSGQKKDVKKKDAKKK